VDSVVSPISLHFHVTWASTSFGWNPVDNLIRIGYIARLAMDAIGSVDLKAIFALLEDHLVHRRRTEILAGITVLPAPAPMTNVGLKNDRVAGLVLFVPRT